MNLVNISNVYSLSLNLAAGRPLWKSMTVGTPTIPNCVLKLKHDKIKYQHHTYINNTVQHNDKNKWKDAHNQSCAYIQMLTVQEVIIIKTLYNSPIPAGVSYLFITQ